MAPRVFSRSHIVLQASVRVHAKLLLVRADPVHAHRLHTAVGVEHVLLEELPRGVKHRRLDVPDHEAVRVELRGAQALVAGGSKPIVVLEVIMPARAPVGKQQRIRHGVDVLVALAHPIDRRAWVAWPHHEVPRTRWCAIVGTEHHGELLHGGLLVPAHVAVRRGREAQAQGPNLSTGHGEEQTRVT